MHSLKVTFKVTSPKRNYYTNSNFERRGNEGFSKRDIQFFAPLRAPYWKLVNETWAKEIGPVSSQFANFTGKSDKSTT